MSQVTNPIILNSTGQDIALALAGLATAIASKPDPATQTPVMDGAGGVGTSTKYAREDHQHPSDTSKANQAQLAYVENGTTASRAYAAGEFFCWNGLLYQAITAIPSGANFTIGTNCEVVSGGGLNSLQTVTSLFNPISSWDSTNTNVNSSSAFMRRMGKMRLAVFSITAKRTASGWQTLGTISDGERTSVTWDTIAVTNADAPTVKYISIGRDGIISMRGIVNGENYRFTVCYFTE